MSEMMWINARLYARISQRVDFRCFTLFNSFMELNRLEMPISMSDLRSYTSLCESDFEFAWPHIKRFFEVKNEIITLTGDGLLIVLKDPYEIEEE